MEIKETKAEAPMKGIQRKKGPRVWSRKMYEAMHKDMSKASFLL